MSKYNKFETVYSNSRLYALGKKAGSKKEDQKDFDATTVDFERFVYATFRQDILMMFGFDVDRNTWVFDQNLLKTYADGRQSLKSLCKSLYFNNEAAFLAK